MSTIRIGQESVVPKRKKIPFSWGVLILSILLLLALGAAGYFYYQTKHPKALSQEQEKNDLVATIGQFLELPADETPTLATVTDKEKLADQAFFQRAENGDQVLIYSASGKAILYRPSTGKIIEVTTAQVQTTPTEVSTPEPEPSPTPEPAEEEDTATVTLYNGSAKTGITHTAEANLKETLSQYEVVAKEKAAKDDYQGTVVVAIAPSKETQAKKIAEALGGTVGILPEGEVAPSTDILVIVGN